MQFARKVAGSWEELVDGFTVGTGDDAIQYPPTWAVGASAEQLAALGIAAIVDEPDVAPCLRLLGKTLVDVAGVPHRRWVTPPAADVRTARRAEVAALRWDEQQTVKWRGRVALADDTTMGRIVAAVMQAQVTQDTALVVHWKFGDSDFADLTFADLIAYGTAIGAHLQGCFQREAELVAAIAAAPDAAAIAAIDISGGWPA
ncbi:DUF4376 domain-containing protein [Sphingomonas sp.]|uniref:DUF4376 domain-containing protein n=1 Tax=Sphingomonas sp. TaxID=28214 RepID=UPI003AFFE972